MSKIEHRDGVWYRDGQGWRSDSATTPEITAIEIARLEGRIKSAQELLDAWREVRRIQADEAKRKADAEIEKLADVYANHRQGTHATALQAVRDEVLRMVARGELEVPKNV